MQVPSIELAAFQPSGLAGSSASPAEAVLLVGFVVALIVAAMLTFPVSRTLLAIYRRRVLTHMLRRARPASNSVDDAPLARTEARSADTPGGLTVEVVDLVPAGRPGRERGWIRVRHTRVSPRRGRVPSCRRHLHRGDDGRVSVE